MRDFLPAIELFAKAIRSGLGAVGALVDCGIPRQHAGEQWLTEFEEENEVLEVPLSADFTDEAETAVAGPTQFDWVRATAVNVGIDPDMVERHLRNPRNSRTNAGATCNRAVEETSEGASPPAAPSDVLPESWVAIAIPVITEVLADHFAEQRFTAVSVSPYILCHHLNGDICGEFADRRDHRSHVAPLIADRLETVTLALPEEA